MTEKIEETKTQENKSISINFTESDLDDLRSGKKLDWWFNGIDVHLYMGEDEETEN